jgi:hypothetical protein
VSPQDGGGCRWLFRLPPQLPGLILGLSRHLKRIEPADPACGFCSAMGTTRLCTGPKGGDYFIPSGRSSSCEVICKRMDPESGPGRAKRPESTAKCLEPPRRSLWNYSYAYLQCTTRCIKVVDNNMPHELHSRRRDWADSRKTRRTLISRPAAVKAAAPDDTHDSKENQMTGAQIKRLPNPVANA